MPRISMPRTVGPSESSSSSSSDGGAVIHEKVCASHAARGLAYASSHPGSPSMCPCPGPRDHTITTTTALGQHQTVSRAGPASGITARASERTARTTLCGARARARA
eukprot:2590333-Rhodomonas_salina.4